MMTSSEQYASMAHTAGLLCRIAILLSRTRSSWRGRARAFADVRKQARIAARWAIAAIEAREAGR